MITWSPGMSLEDIENKVVEKAYDYYRKNAQQTANSLKISLEKLQEKIKNFAIKEQEVNEALQREKMHYQDYLRRARGTRYPSILQKDVMRMPYEKIEQEKLKKEEEERIRLEQEQLKIKEEQIHKPQEKTEPLQRKPQI